MALSPQKNKNLELKSDIIGAMICIVYHKHGPLFAKKQKSKVRVQWRA